MKYFCLINYLGYKDCRCLQNPSWIPSQKWIFSSCAIHYKKEKLIINFSVLVWVEFVRNISLPVKKYIYIYYFKYKANEHFCMLRDINATRELQMRKFKNIACIIYCRTTKMAKDFGFLLIFHTALFLFRTFIFCTNYFPAMIMWMSKHQHKATPSEQNIHTVLAPATFPSTGTNTSFSEKKKKRIQNKESTDITFSFQFLFFLSAAKKVW